MLMANTPGGPMKKQQLQLIQTGVELLKEKKNYSQLEIVEKLGLLEFKISEAALSKIVRNQEGGSKVLKVAVPGIQRLVKQEMGLIWQEEEGYVALPEWSPEPVGKGITQPEPAADIIFYKDGRLTIAQKVAFFKDAQEEVIEFGIVLNTFTTSFFSRNKNEFRKPVCDLLSRGVDFKCYLLNPDAEETKMYFNDRAKHLPDEVKSVSRIREVIQKLGTVQQDCQKEEYSGAFEIYTYSNIPCNYFMAVDGDSDNGKIMVSHYIYGELRANCPVMEFSRKRNPEVYELYWNSLKKMVKLSLKIER